MKILLLASLFLSVTLANATVIVSHRGENSQAPQNTIEAFNIAWNSGVKYVEGDFYETKSGEIICIHGSRELKMLTGSNIKLEDINAENITSLNIANNKRWKDKFKFLKLPTIREIMATVPKDGTLVLEMKNFSPTYAQKVDDARKEAGLSKDQILLISFSAKAIKEFNSNIDGYKSLWLYSLKMKDGKINITPADAIAKCKEIGAYGIDVGNTNLLGAYYVSEVKNAGLKFYVWTVNTIPSAQRMKEIGVDGITTDKASKFFKELNVKKTD